MFAGCILGGLGQGTTDEKQPLGLFWHFSHILLVFCFLLLFVSLHHALINQAQTATLLRGYIKTQ